MTCTCPPGVKEHKAPRPCPVHWPDYFVKSTEAGVAQLARVADILTEDRRTAATDVLNALGELVLPHFPPPYGALLQQLLTKYGPIAIERAVVRAQSITVVDERRPGAVVDLVDERQEDDGA